MLLTAQSYEAPRAHCMSSNEGCITALMNDESLRARIDTLEDMGV